MSRQTTFGVHKFGIKINIAIPFNGVKSDTNALKVFVVRDFVKDAEIKIGFHIQHTFFAVLKCDMKRKIFTRDSIRYRWIHIYANY